MFWLWRIFILSFTIILMLNTKKIRADFPSLQQLINKQPPIYFDNSCMSLRPKQVIAAMDEYYEKFPACGDRSLHLWGEEVTRRCEKARNDIGRFINAKPSEIIFTRNTTEGINLVAQSFFNQRSFLAKEDFFAKKVPVVITSDKEHNSNLIPWQLLEKQGKIKRVIIKTNKDGTFNLEAFKKAIEETQQGKPRSLPAGRQGFDGSTEPSATVRGPLADARGPLSGKNLVSLVYTSNLDGVTNPVEKIVKISHQSGFLVLLDAAQTAPHQKIDVKKLDCDFLAFSGHKMLGPSGMGVLYGKYELLKQLPPFLVGGETVANSTYETAEFLEPPHKFEAGLQNYAGIIGLGAAINYLSEVGLENIHHHETELNIYLDSQLRTLKSPGQLTVLGPADPALRGGITSFTVEGMDHHKIALLLNSTANIMVRSGSFCVHSWFNDQGIKGAVRASLYLYNTKEEIDILIQTLEKILKL